MSIAIFPSLPTGLDLAVQLVGETIQIPGAWASINCPSPLKPRQSFGSD